MKAPERNKGAFRGHRQYAEKSAGLKNGSPVIGTAQTQIVLVLVLDPRARQFDYDHDQEHEDEREWAFSTG